MRKVTIGLVILGVLALAFISMADEGAKSRISITVRAVADFPHAAGTEITCAAN